MCFIWIFLFFYFQNDKHNNQQRTKNQIRNQKGKMIISQNDSKQNIYKSTQNGDSTNPPMNLISKICFWDLFVLIERISPNTIDHHTNQDLY